MKKKNTPQEMQKKLSRFSCITDCFEQFIDRFWDEYSKPNSIITQAVLQSFQKRRKHTLDIYFQLYNNCMFILPTF